MKKFEEIFFGKDYSDKNDVWKKELLIIQDKHSDFFKSRPSIINDEYDMC